MNPLRRDLWSTRLNSVQPLLVELIGLGDFTCARTSSAIRGTTLRAPAVYADTSDCASDHRRRRRVLARNRVQAPWLPSLCARWLPGPRSRPAFLLAPTRALEAGRLQVRRNSSPLRSTARRGRRDASRRTRSLPRLSRCPSDASARTSEGRRAPARALRPRFRKALMTSGHDILFCFFSSERRSRAPDAPRPRSDPPNHPTRS